VKAVIDGPRLPLRHARSVGHCTPLLTWGVGHVVQEKDLIEKQTRFWVLMAQGSTLQAACDAVGVNRRTGHHWRQATGGQVPRKKPEPSGRYLNVDERLWIADLRLAGNGVRDIATAIGLSNDVMMPTHLHRPRVNLNALLVYLTTHHDREIEALERLERMLVGAEGATAVVLHQLNADIAAEQEWVKKLRSVMQLPPPAVRRVRVVSKYAVSKLRYRGRFLAAPESSPTIDLETVIGGVTAKAQFWETLTGLADALPVDREELSELQTNAQRQLHHLRTAHQNVLRSTFIL